MWYRAISRYYEQGLYSKADVKVFVKAGKITPEEYEAITGEKYEE